MILYRTNRTHVYEATDMYEKLIDKDFRKLPHTRAARRSHQG